MGERKKCQNVIFEYSEIPYSLIILFWVVYVSVKWNLITYYNLFSTLWWVIIFFTDLEQEKILSCLESTT